MFTCIFFYINMPNMNRIDNFPVHFSVDLQKFHTLPRVNYILISVLYLLGNVKLVLPIRVLG